MSALERLAAVKATAVLRRTTLGDLARSLGVSYNHFFLVVRGGRLGSERLENGIAAFLGRPRNAVFPARDRSRGVVARRIAANEEQAKARIRSGGDTGE